MERGFGSHDLISQHRGLGPRGRINGGRSRLPEYHAEDLEVEYLGR